MKKEYKGHSHIFTVYREKIPFPEGVNNPSDQEQIINILKDLHGQLSVAALRKIILWSLQQIKESQDKNPADVSHFEKTVDEIKKEMKKLA